MNVNAKKEKKYQMDVAYKWCTTCQVNYFKKYFTSWTCENEEINKLIQEIQLKIIHPYNIIFEWIPYDQFNKIKKIGQGGFAMVYSAIWKDGPIIYNHYECKYERIPEKLVALKRLYNSQYVTKEFLNEV